MKTQTDSLPSQRLLTPFLLTEKFGVRPVGEGVHSLPRMSVVVFTTEPDPRIPTMPGRRTSGFHRPGRHCWCRARSALRCSPSRIKGELHPTQNCLWGGIGYPMRCKLKEQRTGRPVLYLAVYASLFPSLCFLACPSQPQAMPLPQSFAQEHQ